MPVTPPDRPWNLKDWLMPDGNRGTVSVAIFLLAIFAAIKLFRGETRIFAGTKYLPAILEGEWHRLITAGYLHVDYLHAGLNILGMINAGNIVEEVFGRKRAFAIFTISTVTGFLASCYWMPRAPSLGASAGIMGLVGALVGYGVVSRSLDARYLQGQCLSMAGIGFIMGAYMTGVDNAAHAGGMAGGFAVAYFAGLPQPIDDTREKLWGLISLVCLLMTIWAFGAFGTAMVRGRGQLFPGLIP